MEKPKTRINNLKEVYRQRFQYLGNLRKLYDDFSYKCFRIDYWKNNGNRPNPIPDWAFHCPAARHELKISQQRYRRHLEDVTSGKVPLEEQDAFYFLRKDIKSIEEE
uniref:Uncharacterized protein n=1 Tax=Panagrolaimus superbus TaxID=310955 RepID=A0A914YFL9_9BILA